MSVDIDSDFAPRTQKAELRALIDDFADNSLRALCVAYTDYENAAADLAADKAVRSLLGLLC